MENNSFVTETDAKYAELQANKALVIVFFNFFACCMPWIFGCLADIRLF